MKLSTFGIYIGESGEEHFNFYLSLIYSRVILLRPLYDQSIPLSRVTDFNEDLTNKECKYNLRIEYTDLIDRETEEISVNDFYEKLHWTGTFSLKDYPGVKLEIIDCDYMMAYICKCYSYKSCKTEPESLKSLHRLYELLCSLGKCKFEITMK